ncbi:MAG: hypothetical protein IT319_09755 [Anaerolineae bacterium]|nr:hypothetical protein [Anaerolineae bacterium]
MNWQELRETYPHSWLVIEADDAYTKDSQRIIPSLTVIASFGSDWQAAWDHYKALHHADKQREYYVVHTDRPRLDIGVIDSFWRVVP